MKTGTTPGYRIRLARIADVDTLPGSDSGICPPGSECARRAILATIAKLATEKRKPLSLRRGRFNEKTGPA